MYLKQGRRSQEIWRTIARKHLGIVVDGIMRGKLTHPDQSEQELLTDEVLQPQFFSSFLYLDKDLFPSGKYYFDMKGPQVKGAYIIE